MSTAESSPAIRPRLGARRITSLLLPPLAWMAVIFYLSDQPNLVPTHGAFQTLVRKTFHVIEYLVLTLCWWRAIHGLIRSHKILPLVAAVAISLGYAASDEFHQSFVTGRNGSPRDVAIDAIGMALACLLVAALYARRRKTGPSRPSAA